MSVKTMSESDVRSMMKRISRRIRSMKFGNPVERRLTLEVAAVVENMAPMKLRYELSTIRPNLVGPLDECVGCAEPLDNDIVKSGGGYRHRKCDVVK
jgi:hypothetical protein